MKNIIFMPFINDDDGKKWRTDLEKDFIENDGAELTEAINTIRGNKQSYKDSNLLQTYYRDLHAQKSKRQEMWIRLLLKKTAELFRTELDKLRDENTDPEKTTVVCALPEFFWYDVNDNKKHPEIINYHKPLYLETALGLLTEPNELMQLTEDHPNMIFFAGTAMWKKINPDDHEDEEIFNSMIVYAGGEYKESITKHRVSGIDGFYGKNFLVVDKTGKIGESTLNIPPVTVFNGMSFTYDICLDFVCGHVGGQKAPLSTELCSDAGIGDIDVNVLIAAGMPVSPEKLDHIKSNVLLRCDGLAKPYGEKVKKAGFPSDKGVCMIEIIPPAV